MGQIANSSYSCVHASLLLCTGTRPHFPPRDHLFLHLESGHSHDTCMGQQDMTKHDTRRDLESAHMLGLACFSPTEDPVTDTTGIIPRLACRGHGPVTPITPAESQYQQHLWPHQMLHLHEGVQAEEQKQHQLGPAQTHGPQNHKLR